MTPQDTDEVGVVFILISKPFHKRFIERPNDAVEQE